MVVAQSTEGTDVVGREEELGALTRFINDIERHPAGLILEGEAGVGKTTLWRAATRMAEGKGYRVLATSGAPTETTLAFAGLGDLLGTVLNDVLPRLPMPQRSAMEATLLVSESKRPPTARVISAALLTALRELSATGPVLVAIDDVQWLDTPTANALSFAIRRLRGDRVGLMFAKRSGERAALLLDLPRAPFAERVSRMELRPLSFGALRRLLLTRTDLRLTRHLLRRIHDTSGGNPFFALELARALARRNTPPEPGEPLPVPADLRILLSDSIARLPLATRDALAVVALLARPSVEAIASATAGSADDLRPAFEANVIEVADGAIRFVHPLIRSVVYAQIPAADRAHWQRRLVDIVSDIEEGAHHLALVSFIPEETIALRLESAGEHARRRGAPLTAAGLLEHAMRLTPEDQPDERARRSVAAADAWLESGDRRRAAALCEDVRRMIQHGPLRADALQRLADKDNAQTVGQAIAYAEEALREAAGDHRREVDALLRLATLQHFRTDWHAAVDCATKALRLAEAAGDLDATASALTALGMYETFLGVGDPAHRYRRAIELEAQVAAQTVSSGNFGDPYWAPQTMLSDWQRKNGELDEARQLLDRQYQRAVEAGDEASRMLLCVHLAELETTAGSFDLAQRWNDEAIALADETEATRRRGLVLSSIAVLAAYRGNLQEAGAVAQQAKTIAAAFGDDLLVAKCRAIRCFAELTAERYDSALTELGPSIEHPVLSVVPIAGDGIEALIGAGRIADARKPLDELADYSERTGLRMFRLLALRCRGLLSAASGDVEGAVDTLSGASGLSAEIPLPFERARTLLALGQVLRRGKQKRLARETLEEAQAGFARLGARRWSERAAAELSRIGGRAPMRWELTPTERRVAQLVAEGLTNREVAGALVSSVRAVEANLTRIYAKLGVRSRTELAHMLAGTETS
jgi:DNA-binding CsgD family transcriptional regulator